MILRHPLRALVASGLLALLGPPEAGAQPAPWRSELPGDSTGRDCGWIHHGVPAQGALLEGQTLWVQSAGFLQRREPDTGRLRWTRGRASRCVIRFLVAGPAIVTVEREPPEGDAPPPVFIRALDRETGDVLHEARLPGAPLDDPVVDPEGRVWLVTQRHESPGWIAKHSEAGRYRADVRLTAWEPTRGRILLERPLETVEERYFPLRGARLLPLPGRMVLLLSYAYGPQELVALDPESGERLWLRPLGSEAAPSFFLLWPLGRDRLVLATRQAADRSAARWLDARSGETLAELGPGPVLDCIRGSHTVRDGVAYGQRSGRDSDSICALDLETREIRWLRQVPVARDWMGGREVTTFLYAGEDGVYVGAGEYEVFGLARESGRITSRTRIGIGTSPLLPLGSGLVVSRVGRELAWIERGAPSWWQRLF